MSTSMGEKQACDTNSANGGIMDSLPYSWNGAQGEQLFTPSRPGVSTLSRLAELITCLENKPKEQQCSSSICKDCGQTFSDLDSLVHHQEREHALQKLHCCQCCGQKFALLSSLQLHKCPSASSTCPVCRGKPQWVSPCPACGAEPKGPRLTEEPFYHDSSPYVCAPCGRSFSHKQELLYHQQAGGCQPAPLSPSSPAATPTPTCASFPPSPSCTRVSVSACTLCSRTFRSPAGLSSHMRYSHEQRKRSSKKVPNLTSDTMFPCRSCDKVFPQTSQLYLHRKEEHRRKNRGRKPQKSSGKSARQRRKGEMYPCLHCGKVFLHHLTRWAHFRHYSAHHQTHLQISSKSAKAGKGGFNLKASKGFRSSQESKSLKKGKLKRGRPRTKTRPASSDSDTDEKDEEYSCKSCEDVFSSQAALKAHEKIHGSVCRCCSVCTGEISISERPETGGNNVYHCVPCAEAFTALDTFLEHCQRHLIRETEEDEDLLSDA